MSELEGQVSVFDLLEPEEAPKYVFTAFTGPGASYTTIFCGYCLKNNFRRVVQSRGYPATKDRPALEALVCAPCSLIPGQFNPPPSEEWKVVYLRGEV